MTAAQKHIPVMLKEVLEHLSPQDGETYVDATFGNGGYSEAILKAANCRLIAIDRDPTVLPRVEELKEKYGSRFEFRQGTFGNFKDLIAQPVNGAVFDIGVSSMQLDEAERGFSFAKDAPLDMRMSCTGRTAADLVNEMTEKELADLDEQFSGLLLDTEMNDGMQVHGDDDDALDLDAVDAGSDDDLSLDEEGGLDDGFDLGDDAGEDFDEE